MFFYNLLGFYPDDIRYYQLALHHKSVPIHTQDGRNLCNERLEFLGDAILNSVITDILYNRFQNEREGFLTNLRSKIVSRESLNHIAMSGPFTWIRATASARSSSRSGSSGTSWIGTTSCKRKSTTSRACWNGATSGTSSRNSIW